jgi:dihydroorotate dehydrogenase electron transfer subunit
MLVDVCGNRRLTADFRLMKIDWPRSFADPLPGQFVMVREGASTDPLWRRPLGVHDFRSGRAGAWISLLFQVVGPTTRDLAKKETGEKIDALGPFGRPFSPEGEEHWLVAGGRGVAPLYFFARSLQQTGKPVRVMIGGCTAGHVLKVRELEKMGLRTEVATEDGSRGRKGLVTELLALRLQRISLPRRKRIVLTACGPEGMMRAVARLAVRFETQAQLSLDTLMACGQGYCQGCSVSTRSGYQLCCREGPVFDARELLW